jgi:arabinofuranosyltransferase
MISELPLSQRLARGSVYFLMTLRWDAFGFIAVACALATALGRRATRPLLAMSGILFYLVYVWVTASAATHMVGRFFAVPFVLAFYVVALTIDRAQAGGIAAAMVIGYSVVNPVASWKLNTPWYQTLTRSQDGYIDTVWFAHREGTGLLPPPAAAGPVVNVCLEDGQRFRESPDRVHVGGCGGGDPIGFFAFGAGPDKWIIDRLALSDPLLARLRPCVDLHDEGWRPGHFPREVPEGYVQSVLSGNNELSDPALRDYYSALRRIVSGPIWSAERLETILAMNLGRFDHLLDTYNRQVSERAGRGQCRF